MHGAVETTSHRCVSFECQKRKMKKYIYHKEKAYPKMDGLFFALTRSILQRYQNDFMKRCFQNFNGRQKLLYAS